MPGDETCKALLAVQRPYKTIPLHYFLSQVRKLLERVLDARIRRTVEWWWKKEHRRSLRSRLD